MDPNVAGEEVTRFLAAWFEVRQLIQAANFNRFQKAGLSATQFMILNILPDNGTGLNIGELARRMNLKPATVARTVDTLEDRQMLTRTKSAEDGRLVLVRITNQGRKLQNSAVGHVRGHIGDLFQAMPPQDREALVHGLESLVRASAGITPENRAALPGKHSSRRSPTR
jgi:DNA-binding MarR family transcriptional regulator